MYKYMRHPETQPLDLEKEALLLEEQPHPADGDVQQQKKGSIIFRKSRNRVALMIALLLVVISLSVSFSLYIIWKDKDYHFQHASVATESKECSQIAKDALLAGGSAIDAAISSFFCLGVSNFHVSGIGGGLVITIYNSSDRTTSVIEALGHFPGLLEFESNSTTADNSTSSGRLPGNLAAVPAALRGLWEAHQRHGGRLPWKRLFGPSIELAQNGVKISKDVAESFHHLDKFFSPRQKDNLRQKTNISIRDSGILQVKGEIRLKLQKLANTYQKIAEAGTAEEFYSGELSKAVIKDINERGGILTEEDLKRCSALKKTPLKVNFEDFSVFTPPSFSGAILYLILNSLSGLNLDKTTLKEESKKVTYYHHLIETLKRAELETGSLGYNLTSEQLESLVSRSYVENISDEYTPCCNYENKSNAKQYNNIVDDRGMTHVSVIDVEGNAVALTATLNKKFGAKFIGQRTGLIFNSFNGGIKRQGFTSALRPISSACPVIVVNEQAGTVKLTMGASGGKYAPSSLAQVMVDYFAFGRTLIDAVKAPRLYIPNIRNDSVYFERGFDKAVVKGLKRKGYRIHKSAVGHILALVQAVGSIADNKRLEAFSDQRNIYGASSGY